MTSPSAPRVSVVIPVFDDLEGLARCLGCIRAQTLAPDEFEVIVVDNGSANDPAEVVERHGGRLLREAMPGSYAARNAGIAAARAPVIAFTDADCLPDPSWLEAGLAALGDDPGLRVVAGEVEVVASPARRPSPAELFDLTLGFDIEDYVASGYGVTANLFTTADTLRAAGLFSTDSKSGGDREWCERSRSHGASLEFGRAAVVRHPARTTFAELGRKQRRIAGGIYERHRRRGHGRGRILVAAVWYLRPSPRVVGRIRTRAPRRGLATFGAILVAFYYVRLVIALELIRLAAAPRRDGEGGR